MFHKCSKDEHGLVDEMGNPMGKKGASADDNL